MTATGVVHDGVGDGMASGWVYERSDDGAARFVLGTVGENPLVCVGINPSTARPGALDRTVTRVARFARDNGFDSWTMLNVYPQIETDPTLMHREHSEELARENERQIAQAVGGRPVTLLAAWGGLIASRPYLVPLLREIVDGSALAGGRWVSLGAPTKHGHPRHPLYVRADAALEPFDIRGYLGI